MKRPNRTQLLGYSPSEFKTLLKRNGHKVPRNFYKHGACTTVKHGRYWRWRWWADSGFVVDMSCPIAEFDRWSNSLDRQFDAQVVVKHFVGKKHD